MFGLLAVLVMTGKKKAGTVRLIMPLTA